MLSYERKKGAFIPSSAQIGSNICFSHGISGIFISQGAKIGDNVRIGANVTITTDVPSNSTVVMEAPRVIAHATMRDNSFSLFGR